MSPLLRSLYYKCVFVSASQNASTPEWMIYILISLSMKLLHLMTYGHYVLGVTPGRPGLLGHYRENRVNFYRIVRVLLCAYVVSRRTLIVFKSNSERLIIRIKYLYGSGIYTEFQI